MRGGDEVSANRGRRITSILALVLEPSSRYPLPQQEQKTIVEDIGWEQYELAATKEKARDQIQSSDSLKTL